MNSITGILDSQSYDSSMTDQDRTIEGWEVSPKQVAQMREAGEDFVLLDVREPPEIATAWIEGAVVCPMSQMRAQLTELEAHAEEKIVVFCHGGVRSMQVTAFLREAGFEDVMSMAGGIDAWSLQVDSSVPRY